MQCAQARMWIHEQMDGTLGPIQSAELQRHLAACADCRALAEDLRAIQDAAETLDPLAPPAHVWLQLAGRLRQEGRIATTPPPAPASSRHGGILLALAAALVLAVGASILLLLPRYRANNPSAAVATSTQAPGNATAADTVQSVEDEFRLAEQHYQNAITKLEQATRLEATPGDPDAIDPQTAALLQKNLRVIDQAIAESRAALRTEPLSAPARDSLFDALKRKVVLLQDTIALMNEMRKGNAAGAAQLIDGAHKS